MGDRLDQLARAKKMIIEKVGAFIGRSSIYEEQPWFLNQVLSVSSPLEPDEMLYTIKKIEKDTGRLPGEKWHERHMDIDILLCEDKVIETESLSIPHPLFHLRNFVLIPLMEIAPYAIHPVLEKTVEELYQECKDTGEVYIFSDDEDAGTV